VSAAFYFGTPGMEPGSKECNLSVFGHSVTWALVKRMYLALYKLNWHNECDSRFVEPFVQCCTATQTRMLLMSDSKLVWLKTACMSCTECLFLVGGPMQGCTSTYSLVSSETCFRTQTFYSRQCAVGSLCSPQFRVGNSVQYAILRYGVTSHLGHRTFMIAAVLVCSQRG
jgi:hypothetical protein